MRRQPAKLMRELGQRLHKLSHTNVALWLASAGATSHSMTGKALKQHPPNQCLQPGSRATCKSMITCDPTT
uniref:Uncharacterized protein n=1 Tax=Setaria italica TaxID=4555 RepID=K3ZBI3_SETIT